jgi:hypothetical protein
MPGPVLRTTFQGWNRQDVASDPSFEAVCLFSALGIVFSLVFLLTIGPIFDVGFMDDQWEKPQPDGRAANPF